MDGISFNEVEIYVKIKIDREVAEERVPRKSHNVKGPIHKNRALSGPDSQPQV